MDEISIEMCPWFSFVSHNKAAFRLKEEGGIQTNEMRSQALCYVNVTR